jgi:ribosomal protein S18 acetylase RimI-like enzyme
LLKAEVDVVNYRAAAVGLYEPLGFQNASARDGTNLAEWVARRLVGRVPEDLGDFSLIWSDLVP